MTNPIALPDSTELAALASVGGRRRPVKVVEHPAFRAACARLAGRRAAPRLPVVSLNDHGGHSAAQCRAGSSMLFPIQEAA